MHLLYIYVASYSPEIENLVSEINNYIQGGILKSYNIIEM